MSRLSSVVKYPDRRKSYHQSGGAAGEVEGGVRDKEVIQQVRFHCQEIELWPLEMPKAVTAAVAAWKKTTGSFNQMEKPSAIV